MKYISLCFVLLAGCATKAPVREINVSAENCPKPEIIQSACGDLELLLVSIPEINPIKGTDSDSVKEAIAQDSLLLDTQKRVIEELVKCITLIQETYNPEK